MGVGTHCSWLLEVATLMQYMYHKNGTTLASDSLHHKDANDGATNHHSASCRHVSLCFRRIRVVWGRLSGQ